MSVSVSGTGKRTIISSLLRTPLPLTISINETTDASGQGKEKDRKIIT